MVDTITPNGSTDTTTTLAPVEGANIAAGDMSETDGMADAKTRFSKAIEEAKAGAAALKDEAVNRTSAYKDKASVAANDWQEQAGAYATQAKDKSLELARAGKSKASEALVAIGQTISGSAATIDEKLGVQYGDYARGAARSLQDTAGKLDEKDIDDLGHDFQDLVRKSPAIAVGIAAVAGFALARLFGGSDKSDT